MKYLFFGFGLVFVILAVGLAAAGTQENWDAAIAALPGVLGALMLLSAGLFHAFDQ